MNNKKLTTRHRIDKIEERLDIRCEHSYISKNLKHFKVFRYSQDQNAYVFDGFYSKKELVEECNQ